MIKFVFPYMYIVCMYSVHLNGYKRRTMRSFMIRAELG